MCRFDEKSSAANFFFQQNIFELRYFWSMWKPIDFVQRLVLGPQSHSQNYVDIIVAYYIAIGYCSLPGSYRHFKYTIFSHARQFLYHYNCLGRLWPETLCSVFL